jgi:hypothetical protein
MFVDKLGEHCFMLTGPDIYYNYYHSDRIYRLKIESQSVGRQVEFKSIDILKLDDSDPNMFEIVLGGDDGSLFFGAVMVNPADGSIENLEEF